ncbi:MAG: hypothetical protein ACFE85_12475 [Candidatus Hodarchaeota archaeon]
MVEIETETIYDEIEDLEFFMYFSGDGFDDPLYWDLLVNKHLPKYKE